MRAKAWMLVVPVGAAMLAACLAFPPGDICGYGICADGGSTDGPSDSKMDGDAAAMCPSGKEPKDDPSCVSDSLGVFVSAMGNDANPGTKASPVKSLTEAFKKVGTKSFVFVCEGAYTESAELKNAASVFGGFKCADWNYTGTKPKFVGTKPEWALRVDGVNGAVQIVDLELVGMDVPMPTKGGSSVAAFVNASMSVSFVRSTLAGGTPQPGFDGARVDFTYPDISTTLKGHDAMGSSGGTANTYTMCPGGGSTTGGKGGDNGFGGDTGAVNYGAGQGGTVGSCGTTGTGKDGNPPSSPTKNGNGANTLGVLSAMAWTPSPGLKGDDGQPGQGGGGGYGSGGGGGGGGGAAGCGGIGGGGGGGGGGSIALVSLTSSVSFVKCTLTAKDGAKGGNGLAGQGGQAQGGNAGVFTGGGCAGGKGGPGGGGGGGGGGAGGLSAGVLHKGGSMPNIDTATQSATSVGMKGLKGTGTAGNDGIDGMAQAILMAP